MTKFKTTLTFEVDVEIDETKFDETFLSEFRASFYPFYDIKDHVEHIAQLTARGLLDDFTEGYGPIDDMGISARTVDWTVDDVTAV